MNIAGSCLVLKLYNNLRRCVCVFFPKLKGHDVLQEYL